MKIETFKNIAVAGLLVSSFSVFADNVKTPEQMPNILSDLQVEEIKLMTSQEMDETRGERVRRVRRFRRNGTLRVERTVWD
jgi:hypothetical protein